MHALDCVIEQMIRDRLAAARASARRAALIRQSKGRPRRLSGIGYRLIDLGRSLMKVARDASPDRQVEDVMTTMTRTLPHRLCLSSSPAASSASSLVAGWCTGCASSPERRMICAID